MENTATGEKLAGTVMELNIQNEGKDPWATMTIALEYRPEATTADGYWTLRVDAKAGPKPTMIQTKGKVRKTAAPGTPWLEGLIVTGSFPDTTG